MPKIPVTTNPIEDLLEHTQIKKELRPYLGYSLLGHDCARFIWFTFRWCFAAYATPRLVRLWSRGDQEELVVVNELRSNGITCNDVLKNQKKVTGPLGHIAGHPDGRCLNVPGAEKTEHSLEIKTANDKRYTEFVRFGIERSNPQYWVQTHCYMKKQKLTRALYIVTNKNNDERLYARLHYEASVADQAEERGIDIVLSATAPERISERADWYKCRYCDANSVCHGGAAVERNCRTCTNVTILDSGRWGCKVYKGAPVPVEFQRKGCTDYYQPFI